MLGWGWVIAESSTAIACHYLGSHSQAHLPRGIWEVDTRVRISCPEGGGGNASRAAATAETAFLRELLEAILARTLPLARSAWTAAPPPRVRLQIVAPGRAHEPVREVLPEILHKYRLDSVQTSFQDFTGFLQRFLTPGRFHGGTRRPQAIRPREHRTGSPRTTGTWSPAGS